jgi:hypothetical protein
MFGLAEWEDDETRRDRQSSVKAADHLEMLSWGMWLVKRSRMKFMVVTP